MLKVNFNLISSLSELTNSHPMDYVLGILENYATNCHLKTCKTINTCISLQKVEYHSVVGRLSDVTLQLVETRLIKVLFPNRFFVHNICYSMLPSGIMFFFKHDYLWFLLFVHLSGSYSFVIHYTPSITSHLLCTLYCEANAFGFLSQYVIFFSSIMMGKQLRYLLTSLYSTGLLILGKFLIK